LSQFAQQHSPIKTAIVHPITPEALRGAIEAEKQKLIAPILVGSLSKTNKTAKTLNLSLEKYEEFAIEHSHAAVEWVKLAHAGKVNMLMKGSWHTSKFMSVILNKEKGLRTDRRISHVFALEIPHYEHLLLLTDYAINIAPTSMDKRDIIQHAIDLSHMTGIEKPKVAILSVIETVSDKFPSTIEAAAPCKIGDYKQICGTVLDGHLAFDNTISPAAAQIKEIDSPVAGKPDILIVTNLETGNMLAKQLEYLAQTKLSDAVLGTRIPIVLTSRADNTEARQVFCALGILYGSYLKKKQCRKLSLSLI
jgi:phosphotransacetylase